MTKPEDWRPPPPKVYKFDPKKQKPDAFVAWDVMQVHEIYRQAYEAGKRDNGTGPATS